MDNFKVNNTADEPLRRKAGVVEENDLYTDEWMRRLHSGKLLLSCCEKARQEGLLAMESCLNEEPEDSFLKFAISFVLDYFQNGIQPECIFEMLNTYAGNETDKKEACMIADVLQYIVSGENERIVKEVIASHIGRTYRNHFVNMAGDKQKLREEILHFYSEKEDTAKSAGLLEKFMDYSDEQIQSMIKCMDNATLIAALSDAPGRVCVKFLSNLSDRLLYFIDEDIRQYQGTAEQVSQAQQKIWKLSENFMTSQS